MIVAAIEAQDAAIIIGAVGALVVAILAPLLKVIVDVRKQTVETNRMVNGRPKDDPTLRDLIEQTAREIRQLRDESFDRHQANSRRIDGLSSTVQRSTTKLDALGDAVAGQNVRIDAIHSDINQLKAGE